MGCEAPLIDIAADRVAEFETEVKLIPQFDPRIPQMISQGRSVCVFNKADPQEVLASWLFAQYLLTNEVQIAYSQTEGYVPVTSKAQQSETYLDYLSRSGEDNEMYYDIKLDAAKLLLENTDNTFVTPVFNGSASLRDAAGQMVENVTKAVRRNQTVNDAYMEKLYGDVTSLYRLDQSGTITTGKTELGELPRTAVALLSALICAWVLIGAYVLLDYIRKKKMEKVPRNH